MTEDTDETRRRFLLGLGVAGTAALAGCGGGGGGDATTTTTTQTTDGSMETTTTQTTDGEMETTSSMETTTQSGTATLRVAHVSPNAPSVDIYVDGSAVLEGVAFGAVSDYLEVPAGERQLRVTPAGDSMTTVFEGAVPVEAGGAYTVAAAGEIGDMAQRSFSPIVLEDDTSNPGSDTARVRVVHVSPDAPAVDVTVGASGDALFDGVAYGESGTVTVPAGDYTLDIRGDTEGNDGDVVASFDASLAGGESYTAFAAGYLTPGDDPADTAFDLVFDGDVGGMGEMTTTMGSSVPAAIDDYLSGANGYDGEIADATGQDSVTIAVGGDGLVFDPVAVRVDAGTTVNWEWMGGTHNVVSTMASATDFDSGDPTDDTDTTFSQSFDDAGAQLYYCEVHRGSGMLGAIDVV